MAQTKDPLSSGAWRGRLSACRATRKEMLKTWQDNVLYRRGKPFKTAPTEDTINVPADWARTRNKQAQLWYQLPEVKLEPRREEWRGVAPVFASALNHQLSEKMHAEHAMNECLGDVINASGIGVVKVGYEATFEDVEMPLQDQSQYPPEEWQSMQAAGQIQMQSTPKPVYECYYARRISPAHFLWPVEFTGSNWQEAKWLGWEGYIPIAEAQRNKWVDAEFEGTSIDDQEWLLIKENVDQRSQDGWVKFAEVFYRPFYFDPNEKDPRKVKRCVIVDGVQGEKSKVVDEDFQWQRYVPPSTDPMTGQATKGAWMGMTAFPIKVMTLTKISDLAIPPSDSEMGRPQVRELIRGRSQMVKQRDHSMPIRWFDTNQVDDEIADRLRKGKYQDMIPMNGPGDHAIGEVARAAFPKETFEFDKVAKQDLDESWSMGNPQMSAPAPGDTTATEIKSMESSLNVRLEFERGWVLRFFLEIAEATAQLMQLFTDDIEYASVVGADGMQSIKPWNRDTVPGEYVFKIKPDSQLKLDAGKTRMDSLNLYKLLRQDPMINPVGLVGEVLEQHGLDPSKNLAPPKPPQPDKPAISYSFKGEDLLNPFVIAIMQKSGTPITPEDIAAAKKLIADLSGDMLPPQPPSELATGVPPPSGDAPAHPGPAPVVQPLNRRYEKAETGIGGSRDANVPVK